ncbi:MAG: KH domain-containing protein [Clostridiaceae bacterium]|nr:KH domain-containing protein [Clostridiaceae bacterium]
MKELLDYIAKSLVSNPDEVIVSQVESDSSIMLNLHVAQSDMGKVIGKQGKIARAIRSVIRAASSQEKRRVIVDID